MSSNFTMDLALIKTPKIENVRMLDRFNAKQQSVGTLYLTATHLIFVNPDAKKETWILHMHIASLEKLPLTTAGSPLQIRCKTFLCVTFVIPRERDCHEIYTTLLQLSQPMHLDDLYCFHYNSCNEEMSKNVGWKFFDLRDEFRRMGAPNKFWAITTMNKDYELCDTYPRYLYVPTSVTTPVVVGSCSFRSKRRLPVLSYLHVNQAAICRCSQPLAGFSARCVEDEQMLNCILRANPNAKYMYVVDTRPRINAIANKAAGKGYENENFYENIKFHFLGIENIHTMRSGLNKLIDTCEMKVPSMNAFLSGLESSGWLKHIKAILETSVFIANVVASGVTALVHCSDGWDRTAQTCSLACLLLDPFYRTMEGFQSLIEKEWLAFGHKFTDRCGLLQGDPKEVSPVFTQFIDCVWQLLRQFPAAFQFNERFLLTLHDHVFSCQFGTFIGNCEKDRVDLRLSARTYSLWGFILHHKREYSNPLFKESQQEILKPNLSPQIFRFWSGMYNRFENGVHPREPITDLLSATKDHSASLEEHILLLQKRITALKELLGHAETPSKDVDSLLSDGALPEKESDDAVLKITDIDRYSRASVTSDAESGFEDGREFVVLPSSRNPAADVTVEQIARELGSIAIDWKTIRNVTECSCSTPFDHFSRKYHCWKCGEVFCTRCIDKQTVLPGHLSQRPVPVCRPCYKEISRSLSVDTP